MSRDYSKINGELNPNYKGGYRKKYPSLFNSWQNMKQRCLNKNHPKYHRYGGRGVTIVDDWLTVEGFVTWALKNGWVSGYSIDRIDNDGSYKPSNCRWITMSENSRAKSTTRITREQADTIRKRVKSGENEHDIAIEYGVVHGTIWYIVKGITHVKDGECSRQIKEIRERNKEKNNV